MPLRFLQVFSLLVVAVCTFTTQSDFQNKTGKFCDTIECQEKCDRSKGSLVNCNATNPYDNKESRVKSTFFLKGNSTISENNEMSVASFETFVILLLVASLLVVWWRKKRLV